RLCRRLGTLQGATPCGKHLVSVCSPRIAWETNAGWLVLCHRASEYEERLVHAPRVAASAAAARVCMTVKKACDWPMKSPMSVKSLTTPIATPAVWVGRIMEHTGRLRSRNGQGSGMIKLVWKVSPPNGAELRSGNVRPLVGSLRGANGRETAE